MSVSPISGSLSLSRSSGHEAGLPAWALAHVFFLHESRRYVCRFCTSHLSQVKKELLHRLQTKWENRAPTPKQPKTKNTKNNRRRERNSCGRVCRERESETGALNSAKLSVFLVPQQTAWCLMGLGIVRNLEMAQGGLDPSGPLRSVSRFSPPGGRQNRLRRSRTDSKTARQGEECPPSARHARDGAVLDLNQATLGAAGGMLMPECVF